MKISFKSLIVAAAVFLGCWSAQAAVATTDATVLKVIGSATAMMPGKTVATPVKVGDKLPQGATVFTGAGSELDLQVMSGSVATIKANGRVIIEKLSVTTSDAGAVTKQSSILNLKRGIVTSNIDPTKKAINDYGIRTPKGVAAARGTVFTVSVTATGQVQLYVTTSVVQITSPTGIVTTVPAGFLVKVESNGEIVSAPVPATQIDEVTYVAENQAFTAANPNASPTATTEDAGTVTPAPLASTPSAPSETPPAPPAPALIPVVPVVDPGQIRSPSV